MSDFILAWIDDAYVMNGSKYKNIEVPETKPPLPDKILHGVKVTEVRGNVLQGFNSIVVLGIRYENANRGRNRGHRNQERNNPMGNNYQGRGGNPGNQDGGRGGQGGGGQNTARKAARAPYNFISLNDRIVPAESGKEDTFDQYSHNLWSGVLDLSIETKTPVFIRKTKEDEQFFHIENNRPIIPGSSLRGMIRTLVEICSWAKFDTYHPTRLYHRGMADMARKLQDIYREEIGNSRDRNGYKTQTGLLNYDEKGKKYTVTPTKSSRKENDLQVDTPIILKDQPSAGKFLVRSGKMGNKRVNYVFDYPGKGNPIDVPNEVILGYQEDINRDKKKSINLVKELKEHPEKYKDGIPVFYVKEKEKIKSFGHTQNYRIPYNLRISDHVAQIGSPDKSDIPSSLFGTTEKASKIHFEDAHFCGTEAQFYRRAQTSSLMGPKPTTFQHYLEQPKGIQTSLDSLNHWGNKGKIRGYKLYWHRKTSGNPSDSQSWAKKYLRVEEIVNTEKTEQQPIYALKENQQFKSRIRFENLTQVELGALLFALELPPDCYHKIGLGKPLGMGSILITSTLKLIDKSIRYQTLMNNTKWEEGEDKNNTIDFRNAFVKYLQECGVCKSEDWKALWEEERLKELKILLSWKNTETKNWNEITRYMVIEYEPGRESPYFDPNQRNQEVTNEFRLRPVLPKPSEVTKPKTYPENP